VQIISLAGWVNIMYYVQDAHSFWDWIYFTALIVVSVAPFSPHAVMSAWLGFTLSMRSHSLCLECYKIGQKFANHKPQPINCNGEFSFSIFFSC